MSTQGSVQIPSCDGWMRVGLAFQLCVKEALLTILHNRDADPCYIGLPDNETDLYNHMVVFKSQHQNKLKNVIRQDQWDVLCPPAGKSNSKDWDITVIVILIRYKTTLPSPNGGWEQKIPQVNDNSKAAFCLRARQLRNDYSHGSLNDYNKSLLPQSPFNRFWAKMKHILNGLLYNNMVLFNELESGSLKLYTSNSVTVLEDRISVHESKLHDLEIKKIAVNTSSIALIQKEVDLLKTFHVQSQEKEEEVKLRLIYLQESLRSLNESRKASNITVKAALHIVADNIGTDWSRLAFALGMTVMERYKIEAMIWLLSLFYAKSNKDKMMAFFENRLFQISWWELKEALKNLPREEIIQEILEKTAVFKELDEAIKTYREKLLDALRDKQEQCSFNGPDGLPIYESMKRQQSYVELAIAKQIDVDKRWMESDRDYHIHQMVTVKKSIKIEDILTTDDNFVVVNGIAGIGKSTLLEMLVYLWSSGRLLNGLNVKSPNIKLLVFIKCRDLNWMDIDENTSVEEIFHLILGLTFRNFDKRSFEEIRKHILIVIDGIDELRGFDRYFDSRDEKFEPITKFVLDLLDPNPLGFLSGKHVIIAGRPLACRTLRKGFERHTVFKKIEVCGFNSEGVEAYVKQRFDSDSSESILTNIRESATISMMVRIPVYLWVITALYKEFDSTPKVETTTELLLYACLVFIRNHYRKDNCESMSLEEICENKDILKHLTALSEFSYHTLMENKVLVPLKDFNNPNLEGMGFLVKGKIGELGEAYQFRHLVLQELFCAIYVFLCKAFDWEDISSDGRLRGCVPLAAGLEGLYVTKRNLLLWKFLKTLLQGNDTTKFCHIMDYLEDEAMYKFNQFAFSDPRFNLGLAALDTYVEGFFEYHFSLSEQMQKYLDIITDGLRIEFPARGGIIGKWLIYYVEQYCSFNGRTPLSLQCSPEELTNNEASFLAKYVSYIDTLDIYPMGDIKFESPAFYTIFIENLIDHLNANETPLKEFRCIMEPSGNAAKVAQVMPFVTCLMIPCNWIRIALDSIENYNTRNNTHSNVHRKDLVIFTPHFDSEFCINRTDMSKLAQNFDSISIEPFSVDNDTKVLDFLENSISDQISIKLIEFKLHSSMSDAMFERLIDDFRLLEKLVLKETLLTMECINFLEKTLSQWSFSEVKCNLTRIEIESLTMTGINGTVLHRLFLGVEILYKIEHIFYV